jgi:hypothetical protein
MKVKVEFETKAEQRATLALLLVAVSAFVDQLLTFKIGGFFFSPYKISLLASTLLTLRYLPLAARLQVNSIVMLSFTSLVIFQLISSVNTTIAEKQSFSNFINTLLMLLSYIFWVTTTSAALIKSGTIRPIIRLAKVLFLCAIVTGSIGYIEAIMHEPLIRYGVFSGGYTGITIRGVHTERLFFGEYVLCGIFFLMFYRADKKPLMSMVAITLFSVIILLSQSYTAIINLFIFFALVLLVQYKLVSPKGLFLIGLIVAITFAWPMIMGLFLDSSDLILLEKKNERYGDMESNWRLFSSLILILEFVDSPSLFGNGMRQGAAYLESLNITNNTTSTHTFISILYNQGILGFASFIVFFLSFSWAGFSMIKLLGTMKKIDPDYYKVGFLVATFIVMCLMRFIFYYQTTFFWVYLYSIVLFVSYKKLCERRLAYCNVLTRNEKFN